MHIEFRNVQEKDLENLVEIRIEAMKESLERIGRFDPKRARERLEKDFAPENTKYICSDCNVVGFFSIVENELEIHLGHLYIKPEFQNQGIGKKTLEQIFKIADEKMKDISVGALKGSRSNDFYKKNGFQLKREEEWDNAYLRKCERKRFT